MTLKWTRTQPTTEGKYLYRDHYQDGVVSESNVVRVYRDRHGFLRVTFPGSTARMAVEEFMDGVVEVAGPIPEPDEGP